MSKKLQQQKVSTLPQQDGKEELKKEFCIGWASNLLEATFMRCCILSTIGKFLTYVCTVTIFSQSGIFLIPPM